MEQCHSVLHGNHCSVACVLKEISGTYAFSIATIPSSGNIFTIKQDSTVYCVVVYVGMVICTFLPDVGIVEIV